MCAGRKSPSSNGGEPGCRWMVETRGDSADASRGGVHLRLNDWIARREALLFAALLVAHLIPVWWFQYFPSLDGPVHLSIADVLVRYENAEVPAFREFYEINRELEPNYFIFAVLYVLMQVAPPLLAEKILLSGYIVLLPLALRYAVRAAAPEAGVIAFLGFPLIYNFPLHMGFYNFSFGMVFFLIAFGFWLKHSEKVSLPVFLGYLFLSLLLYFTHLFALAITCAAIAFTTLGMVALEFARQHRAQALDPGLLWRRLRTRALIPAAAYLPAILLGIWFYLSQQGNPMAEGVMAFSWPIGMRAKGLMVGATLVSHDSSLVLVSKAFVISLLAVAGLVVARKMTGAARLNGLFFCFLGVLCLYLFTPSFFWDRWMPQRLMPYVFITVVLWFASELPTAIARRAVLVRPFVVIVVAAISLVGLSMRSATYAKLNDYIGEYLSALDYIEPNATLLSLRIGVVADDNMISDRVDLFFQAAAYIQLQRSVIDLTNFQAATGYFPIIYRQALDPYRHLAEDREFIALPPGIDFLPYAERTGKAIDYVLLWGSDAYLHRTPRGQRLRARLEQVGLWHSNEYPHAITRVQRLRAQLEEAYELIYTSPQRGLTRLYRLKKANPQPVEEDG